MVSTARQSWSHYHAVTHERSGRIRGADEQPGSMFGYITLEAEGNSIFQRVPRPAVLCLIVLPPDARPHVQTGASYVRERMDANNLPCSDYAPSDMFRHGGEKGGLKWPREARVQTLGRSASD
jgi:hypothetical protein